MRLFLLLVFITIFNFGRVNADASVLSLDDAKHLLNRTGFGASPAELAALIGIRRTEAIDIIVGGLASQPEHPLPAWTNDAAPHYPIRNELTTVQRRKFNEARELEVRQLRQWWIREMIETGAPQHERLVLFWHNHFATGFSAINDQSIAIAQQHATIRQHAAGNFGDFLRAIIRDPAMLNYLDNDNSRKSAPNENLARELLELFTMGEGNYAESDIKNIARALTGHSINRYNNLQFVFKPQLHDNGTKEVFGQQGQFDGDDVIDLILQQPAAARFIATKFWHAMVSHEPPEYDQIEPLASAFREADYEITALYKALLSSDAFWDEQYRTGLIRSPASLTIGTIRSTGIVPINWQTLALELKALGQDLFEPPNVAGWPGGKSWITPGRLLNRLEWLRTFDSTCEHCESNMMAGNAMMSTRNTASDTAPAMNTNSMNATSMNTSDSDVSNNSLVITMASEEFDEPVAYRVTLFADDTILWTSGNRSLPGGRDTKRFGRARGVKNLPWRDVYFPLPETARRFDAIEINYLNDKAHQGADRNLYIQQAAFNNRVYEAAQGLQTNNCPKIKRSKGGTMLCNGKLLLNKSASNTSASDTRNTLPDRLIASGVYLKSLQNPLNGKRPGIQFYLTDMTINNRHWHSLTANVQYLREDGYYRLVLQQNNCWPECFEQWPQCGNNNPAVKRWSVTIDNRYHRQCGYRKLTHNDQALIDSLIALLPDFYQRVETSRKLNRPEIHRKYVAWAPHIRDISNTVTSFAASRHTAPTLTIAEPPASSMTINSSRSQPPRANGRTRQQYQQDFSALLAKTGMLKQSRETAMSRILLPGNQQSNADTLTNILTELTYQLQ